MQVIATDSANNVFLKTVTIKEGERGPIINFGGFCEYYASDLTKKYPYDHPLNIDVMGLNHKGYPDVCVSATDMNRILETLGFAENKVVRETMPGKEQAE